MKFNLLLCLSLFLVLLIDAQVAKGAQVACVQDFCTHTSCQPIPLECRTAIDVDPATEVFRWLPHGGICGCCGICVKVLGIYNRIP